MNGTLHVTDLRDTDPLFIADCERGDIEWDRLLQSLVLECCDLFAEELEPEHADAGFQAPQSTSLGSTLRDARRTGALGDLCEEAQTTLLSGTLYTYGGSNSETADVCLPSAMVSLGSTFSSAPRIGRRSRSDELQPAVVDLDEFLPDTPAASSADAAIEVSTLRGTLERALQIQLLSTTGAGWWEGGSAAAAPRRGAPGSGNSSMAGASSRISAPEVVWGRSLSAAPTEDFAGTTGLHGTARVFTSTMGSDYMGTERTTSRSGATTGFELGETVFSETDRVFNETLRPEEVGRVQAVDGGLVDILHRLMANDASLDESLLRSVRRVLQLTTVLTGHRLSDAEIERLPKVSFDRAEDQCCAICFDSFRPGELLTELRCNHFFHVDCVSKWFQRSAQCPLCRAQQGEELVPELLT